MEQGIYTSSTKDRLQQLEEKKAELEMKIAVENSKIKTALTKTQITDYLQKCVKLQPKPMIDHLIEKVVLYNDKIEIYCKYTNNDPAGTKNRRGFSFYEKTVVAEINKHLFGGKLDSITYIIVLFV